MHSSDFQQDFAFQVIQWRIKRLLGRLSGSNDNLKIKQILEGFNLWVSNPTAYPIIIRHEDRELGVILFLNIENNVGHLKIIVNDFQNVKSIAKALSQAISHGFDSYELSEIFISVNESDKNIQELLEYNNFVLKKNKIDSGKTSYMLSKNDFLENLKIRRKK